jgi:rhodanese-related sulfurtransferase
MDPRRVVEIVTDAQLLDVRSRAEWQTGSLSGAYNIPLFRLPEAIASLDPTRQIVIICNYGIMGEVAAGYLQGLGFSACSIEGGLERWSAEGWPLFTSDGRRGELVA